MKYLADNGLSPDRALCAARRSCGERLVGKESLGSTCRGDFRTSREVFRKTLRVRTRCASRSKRATRTVHAACAYWLTSSDGSSARAGAAPRRRLSAPMVVPRRRASNERAMMTSHHPPVRCTTSHGHPSRRRDRGYARFRRQERIRGRGRADFRRPSGDSLSNGARHLRGSGAGAPVWVALSRACRRFRF